MARSSLIPGFRFHPTDVELVMYYLKNKLMGKKIALNVVAEVNIYDYFPSDLPDMSSLKSGDLEWYFFCPKSKKYSSGGRANRSTETGFWKATGKDRKVTYKERTVATIKTLVFHLGHAGKGESKGQRTDWVMHEYRMDDEQLATAGVLQDKYVLCKIFEKSGSGPKNGAQYGAPFNEEEWDDDLVSSLDTQAIFGPHGASCSMDHKQKGPATTNMTEPGSSAVTFSANEPANTLNHKQKGPDTTNMSELVLSCVRVSANEPTNTLDYKQKGAATMSMTEPGSSIVVINEPTMNMTVPQSTHGLSVTEPGSSSVMLPTNEMPANDDVIFLEEIMGVPEGAANGEKVKTVTPNKDDIFDDLVKIINLEDLNGNDIKTNEAEYLPDKFLVHDDLDMGIFFVD